MHINLTRRSLATALLGLACPAVVHRLAHANPASLPTPTGRPILTITGKIGIKNSGDATRLDREGLEALGSASFTTSTPWYPAPVRFDGVPMTRLMEAVNAFGENAVATALNDYVTQIPIEDFARYGVLLALKRDGEYMPVRDRGPLFVIYPFDSRPELQHQRFYSRSAWQLARLEIR